MGDSEDRLRELEGRIEREGSVAELGRRALTGTSSEKLLELAVADAARMVGTERAAILCLEGNELRCASGSARPSDAFVPCGWIPARSS